jgi:anti-anti-sigma factor
MQPTVTVDAPTRLDGITSGDFGAFLIRIIEGGACWLILDLGALDYLSSAGVRALLLAHKALVARQGKMVLLSCRPSVQEVLRICGFEALAPRVESIEAARLVVRRP